MPSKPDKTDGEVSLPEALARLNYAMFHDPQFGAFMQEVIGAFSQPPSERYSIDFGPALTSPIVTAIFQIATDYGKPNKYAGEKATPQSTATTDTTAVTLAEALTRLDCAMRTNPQIGDFMQRVMPSFSQPHYERYNPGCGPELASPTFTAIFQIATCYGKTD